MARDQEETAILGLMRSHLQTMLRFERVLGSMRACGPRYVAEFMAAAYRSRETVESPDRFLGRIEHDVHLLVAGGVEVVVFGLPYVWPATGPAEEVRPGEGPQNL